MKTMLLAAALLSSPPAAAADAPFCTMLRRLAAGAEETPAFASLAGTDLGALLGSRCLMPSPAAIAYLCTRSLSPPGVSDRAVIDKVRACLPGTTIATPPRWETVTRLRHGRLILDVDENGSEDSHVGRTVTLYFEAAEAAPRGAR